VPFTSFRLTNGLSLWGLPRTNTGTVSLALIVPVGGRHDPPRRLGLAHMVEHMVFCGTRRWSEVQLCDEIERRGGLWQAHTYPEATAYFVHLPAGELAFGLRALQQLVFAPTFPAQALPREQSIIAREAAPETSRLARRVRVWLLRLGLQSFPEELSRHALFGGTGLEQPVIGFAETRRQITLDDVRAYHARWYQPARTQLLAVGDFAAADLQALAQHTFGRLPAGDADSPPVRHPRCAQRQRSYRSWGPSNRDVKQCVGLPFGDNSEAERAAAHLLTWIIYDAAFNRLRRELGLVYSIHAETVPFTDGGLIWLTTTLPYQNSPRLEYEVNAILDQLCAGDISETQLERVRASTIARWVMNLQSNSECAETLSESPEIALGQAPVLFSERLATVTADELRQTASRLLTAENRQWVIHRPSLVGIALALVSIILALVAGGGALAVGLTLVRGVAKAWLMR
jgi:zinc protease